MIPQLSHRDLALRDDVTAVHPMGARYMSKVSNHDRRCFWSPAVMTMAAMALVSLAGSVSWFASSAAPREAFAADTRVVQPMRPAAVPLPIEGELPALGSATAWLNSPPLTAAGLRGKVVLINFWTYTCINWLRQLPYVRAWAETYQAQGLVVIGVHTPEFAFEHDIDHVRQAAKDMRVEYPIAIDNGYALWRAFKNAYWPALYVVDVQGRIRHHHFGEGEYTRSERMIQQLLAEAGLGSSGQELVTVEAHGAEAAADWGSLQSPETYVGYARSAHFASPGGAVRDRRRVYAAPERLRLNQWALAGEWTVGKQAAVLHTVNGRIVHRFHARDLHLVMGPATRDTPVRFRVRLDGQPPGAAHGLDVDDQGHGTVTDPRMYQLIRQPPPIAERQVEIEFLDTGVEAFALTFG
jgi:thiol-disulfide isomerase/thioredoxin